VKAFEAEGSLLNGR